MRQSGRVARRLGGEGLHLAHAAPERARSPFIEQRDRTERLHQARRALPCGARPRARRLPAAARWRLPACGRPSNHDATWSGRCAAAETSQDEPMAAAMAAQARASSRPSTITVASVSGLGQHLDGDVGHGGERAPGAGQHLAHVVAGDVLHHAAAGLDGLGAAGDGGDAEEMIARGAGLDAARAGEIGSDGAADGALARLVRRAAGRNPSARRRVAGCSSPAAPRSRPAACRRCAESTSSSGS